jgi:membrane associated rhomboid family serine protease
MTPPAFAAIPARSERQAMDWSLVLISQGIEPLIERDAEAGRWLLVVNEPDYPRAVDALRRYQAENRAPRWQHTLPAVGLLFDLRSLGCLLFLGLLFALEPAGQGGLRNTGVMDNHLVHAGQWWRLFTAVTLHGDYSHLAANLSTGFLLLGLAMGAYGYGVGLLMSYLAGVGGFFAGLIFLPESHRSLGASGMVLGALGLLGAQWVALLRHGITPKQIAARGMLSGCLLLVLLGLSPRENTDVLAHVAGFLTGLFLGAVLAFCPRRLVEGPWPNRLALALTLALVLGPWWLALRH